MATSQEDRNEIYRRAGGRCECTMTVCSHHKAGIRCATGLTAGHWDAHHIDRTKPATPSNLIAMCATCHKNTRTYGRPR